MGIASLLIFSFSSISFAAFKLGEVVTIAGTGEIGYEDGNASLAKFSSPSAAIEGPDGTIYISDTLNHRIRVVTPQNQVRIFAGKTTSQDEYGFPIGGYKDGNVGTAMFNEPKGLALSQAGILYIADAGNNAIRAIDNNGVVSTITTELNSPSDIVIDSNGQLIISDTLNHRIVKVTEQGEASVLAGGGYSQDGDWLVGGYADGKGQAAKFNEPSGLAIDAAGNVYVADTGNQRIRKIDAAGNVTTVAGTNSSKIDGTSYITGGFKNGDLATAQFNFPIGLAFDQEGNLFVADSLNHVIRVITKSGKVDTVAGVGEESGNRIGPESKALFDRPSDVTVLKNGKLLIVDQMNNKVRELHWYSLPPQVKSASSTIQVVFTNKSVTFSDAQPKVVSGRTLIPLRAIAETFGYEVDWNNEKQEITIKDNAQTLLLKVGQKIVNKDKAQFSLDVAPLVEEGTNRTYVPLRFVAEAFDYQVDWLNKERVVLIR